MTNHPILHELNPELLFSTRESVRTASIFGRRVITPLEISAATFIADLLLVALAGLIAHGLAHGFSAPWFSPWSPAELLISVAAPLIVCGVLIAEGAYNPGRLITGRPRFGAICFGLFIAAGLLSLCGNLLQTVIPTSARTDRSLLRLVCLSALFVVSGRIGCGYYISRSATRLLRPRRAVLVGGGLDVVERLNAARSSQTGDPMQVVGVVALDQSDGRGVLASALARTEAELFASIHRSKVDVVVIAATWNQSPELKPFIAKLQNTPVDIQMLVEPGRFRLGDRTLGDSKILLLPMRKIPMDISAKVIKKIEDVAIGTAMLILFSPLMAAIALAIKLDSSGPVLFRQERYGIRNKRILVRKFRTMYHDREDAFCERQISRADDRVTPVGRILRRFSLDELPQILNVLSGEMSVVGPRPHAAETKAAGKRFEDAIEYYMARHQVKPGMTGWAQVKGFRGETDTLKKLEGRLEHDLFYIQHWSFWLDIRILLRTFGCVMGTTNAF